MKSRNQQGSAHLIIIIALVVVVLGALGVIFWQNFMNKPVDTETVSTSSDSNTSPSKHLIGVSEWGVKGETGELENASYTITTETSQTSGDYEVLRFSATPSLPDNCKESYGKVVRLTADQQMPNATVPSEETAKEAYDSNQSSGAAHVEDYYYFFYGSTGNVCWENDSDPIYAKVLQIIGAANSFVATLTVDE
jgi:cytoskeletal protein RodZ